MKKKVVPTLRQEVKVKVDIVTSDDIKIYYTGKFQDFTARYVIKFVMKRFEGRFCYETVQCEFDEGLYLNHLQYKHFHLDLACYGIQILTTGFFLVI